jgi:AcrR family transcriptional regulator
VGSTPHPVPPLNQAPDRVWLARDPPGGAPPFPGVWEQGEGVPAQELSGGREPLAPTGRAVGWLSCAAVSEGGRLARNRRRRSQEFLDAGLRIITDEGVEALTMARLAHELDTAVGAVYRYYASKDEMLAAIQGAAVERFHRSHDRSVEPVVAAVGERVAESAELVRLVVLGRWLCAAAEVFPEEIRLLQVVSARRSSTMRPETAAGLVLPTLALLGTVRATIDAAAGTGDLRPGDGLARAIMWLTAFGGVFVADDLEPYVPEVLGGGRLIRRLNADLVVGWGAPVDAVGRIDDAIDALDGTPPLLG